MDADLVPPRPAQVPNKDGALRKAIGRWMLRMLGWRVVGDIPNVPKAVIALGPHTSNWDFIIGMAAIMAAGVEARYLMKKEAFIWPFSKLFVALGGVPLDRRATEDTVDQLVAHFNRRQTLWVAITPEGTRQKVRYWKNGFLRIAARAEVPVLIVAWDYPSKTFVLDGIWPTGNDPVADAAAIREHVHSRYSGKHPELQ